MNRKLLLVLTIAVLVFSTVAVGNAQIKGKSGKRAVPSKPTGRAGGNSGAGKVMGSKAPSRPSIAKKSPSFGGSRPKTSKPSLPKTRPSQSSKTRPSVSPLARPSTRPQAKPTTRPQTNPVTRPQTKPVTRPQTKPVTRPQTKPVTRPQTRPGAGAIGSLPQVKPSTRPKPRPGDVAKPKPVPPAINRPSDRPSRPSIPGSIGNSRPGTKPAVRPGRPDAGGGGRPGIGSGIRPGTGGDGNRPAIGGGNRPGIGDGNRPGSGGSNRPGIGDGNRPAIGGGNRPGIGGGNRPGIGDGNRPGIGDGNRPGFGNGNRPGGGINHRPNRPVDRPNNNWGNDFQIGDNHQMNNFVNNINNNFTHISNNYNVFNPGGWNNFSNNWNRYNHWGSWHNRAPIYGSWYHGSWSGNYGSGWGYAAGLATSALVSSWAMGPTVYDSGYYTYSNPYYTEPLVINVDGGQQTVIQYSQPLPAVPVEVGVDSIQPDPYQSPVSVQSIDQMDQAREAFASGDYNSALQLTNGALATSPNDPVIHQFRALVLFALKDYRQATAALYSVLSVGPPWDWTTMSSLYPNTDIYSDQFHQLENFAAANPDAAYAHFLAGYHYMVCGYNDQSIDEFKLAHKLESSDQLAASLVSMLGGSLDESSAAPLAAEELASEMVQVDPANLFGHWITDRNNGPNIDLKLMEDGKFTWTVGQGDQAKALTGEFSLGGDKLALQPEQGGPMMGTVTIDDGAFNFRIVGAPPGDQGLQFQRN